MKAHTERLTDLNACDEAIEESKKFSSMQDFWDHCDNPFWLIWYLAKTEPEAEVIVRRALNKKYNVDCFSLTTHIICHSVLIESRDGLIPRPEARITVANVIREMCPTIL